MSHSATLGDVEVPVTYSKDEAVGLMQEAGIVGAGGAGFPTYVKYRNPPHTLIVNGADSEPGYYKDKLLLRDEPEALVDVFDLMQRCFGMDTVIIAAETVAEPYMEQLKDIASDLENFSIAFIEPKYKFGQERALVKAIMGMEVPQDHLPQDHGIVVNNVETLFNVYRAEFRERPVTTKFMQVYGEATPNRVYEVPVGTLACDLLRIHGYEPGDFEGHKLYDGGPVLADCVADPMPDEPLAPVRKNTNAFLVVHPDKDRPRNKHYPHPDYDHNSVDAPWAADEIINVEDRIFRVRVPLRGEFWSPGKVLVSVGDKVQAGDEIAAPGFDGLTIGTHASIDGTVVTVGDDFVEIVG